MNQDYFKQNEAAINARIVKPIEENQPQVLGQDAAPTSPDNVSQSSVETSKT